MNSVEANAAEVKANAIEDALIDFGSEAVFLTASQETMARFMRERVAELRAGAIIAAGYRKPRTITTLDGLEGLSLDAVIRDSLGQVWHKLAQASWRSTSGYVVLLPTLTPATVLYEPPA